MPPGRGSGYEDFHEEQALGKVYDGNLVRRLMKYAKPYTKLFILTITLVIFLSALQIAQPYITKIAIDRFIIFSNAKIDLSDESLPVVPDVLERHRDKLLPLQEEGIYLLDANELDPGRAAWLEAEELIGREKFYIVDLSKVVDRPAVEEVLSRHEEKFEATGDPEIFIIDYSTLREISRSDLMTVRGRDRRGILIIGAIFVLLLVTVFLLQYAQIYLMTLVGQNILFDIRNALFRHIQTLSLRFFDSNPVGRLVTRSTNDVNVLNEMFTSVLITLFSDLFKFMGISVMLLIMNWRLGLLLMAITPLIMAATLLFRIKFRAAYRRVRLKIARINATLSEHFSGIRIIKIFARENENFRRFEVINRDYYKANMYEITIHGLFSPVIVFFRNLGLALVLWFGGGQVIQNLLPLGALVAYLQYIEMFFQPINALAEKFNVMQSAMASSERIFQIMDEKPDIVAPENPVIITDIKGSVEFDDVWFAYKRLPDNSDWDWILKGVSWSVEPGQSVAIVGETGAGKTTIISLLSRFYDIQRGSIRVDGIDLRDWDMQNLRRHIGVVLQDVFLFARDIKSNIRLNNGEIEEQQLAEFARTVNAHKFIERLPNQFDEPVTERGSTLSSGQRQLLAFARVLAFDPSILVLDEATSNIDTETEQLIQEALLKLIRNRTSIIIAHRLSTIQHVDRILVMHKGKLVEQGNHQQLLAHGGIYYKLYQLQYKGQEVGA
ncbi:MAG TPA: ABC transporter ATP-binding protein [candidate division Zixibacteria bacterium]|nr:ABC transporter ATP-binding protein [candidate division Zixibacteria bacterium]